MYNVLGWIKNAFALPRLLKIINMNTGEIENGYSYSASKFKSVIIREIFVFKNCGCFLIDVDELITTI